MTGYGLSSGQEKQDGEEVEMVNLMLDEIAAAAEIMADDAMSIADFLYEEAEATAEFLMHAAAWMESVLSQATSSVMKF